MSWYVVIRHHTDAEEPRVLGPYSTERQAARVEGGASINLDHEDWSVYATTDISGMEQYVGANQ